MKCTYKNCTNLATHREVEGGGVFCSECLINHGIDVDQAINDGMLEELPETVE